MYFMFSTLFFIVPGRLLVLNFQPCRASYMLIMNDDNDDDDFDDDDDDDDGDNKVW